MSRVQVVTGVAVGLFLIVALLLVLRRDGDSTAKPSGEPPSAPAVRQETPPARPQPDGEPVVEVVPVVEQTLNRTVRLPGELQPFLSVDLYPKVTGIIEWIGVDRGSRVKKGEVLVRLIAPELTTQRLEAEAKLHADQVTYERLRTASATPGVVAPNDLEVSQKTVEADRARARTLKEMEGYLIIAAPFDGVVTERHMHPGALVGPQGGGPGGTEHMLHIEQTSHLRLMVPVPEAYVGGLAPGETVPFTVPAYPAETFRGTIARIAQSVDVKTRTMPVELDVANPSGRLAPGMFPEVEWPVRRSRPSLFVPAKAVVTTTELTFIILVRDGKAEWVTVRRGQPSGGLVEVFGDLKAGDQVVLRGTDELRSGTRVTARVVPPPG
jgi:RND family efflux transporter MFP subunit